MEAPKQINKSLTTQLTAKQQEILDFSRTILAGQCSIATVEMGLTIQKVFEKPVIKSVFKGNDAIIFGVVKILINRFSESFGFSTKLTDIQLEILTVDILENFKYETLDDIILFLKMSRTGKFGVAKKGIDSNMVIGEWMPQYFELKAIEREKIYEKTKVENPEITIEQVRRQYEINQKKGFRQKVLNYIDKITTGINRQQLELLIIEWEQDEQKKPYLRDLKAKRLSVPLN